MMKNRNTSVLFIVPYQLNTAPGQRFRFEYYLDIMRENQIDYEIRPFLSPGINQILYKDGNLIKKVLGIFLSYLRRFSDLISASKYDFIFIFREAAPAGPPLFEWVIAKIKKKKIIYDFDDAIWINDPSERPLLSFIKNKGKVKNICKWSYKVVVGNDYLASFADHFNDCVVIIPTVIDTEVYMPDQVHNPVPVIGWTGSHSTLIYLNEIMPVLRELNKHYDFTFLIIANSPPVFEDDFISFVPWNYKTEVKNILRMDIGLMPLTVTPWSEGKCGLKILQYMALGIPAVASDVGVNGKIINHGENGFICKTIEDWKSSLQKLLKDGDLRKKMGQKGRKLTEEHYSVTSTKKEFLSLFN